MVRMTILPDSVGERALLIPCAEKIAPSASASVSMCPPRCGFDVPLSSRILSMKSPRYVGCLATADEKMECGVEECQGRPPALPRDKALA
jgi:hypothetical protein